MDDRSNSRASTQGLWRLPGGNRQWRAGPATNLLLALTCIAMGACTQQTLATTRHPVPTFTGVPSATPTVPTSTPTSTPTATRIPTSTLRPTLTPIISHTPSPTPWPRYIVRPGDTVAGVAKRCGTTLALLVAANNISDTGRIEVGQVLLLPPGAIAPTLVPGTPSPTQILTTMLSLGAEISRLVLVRVPGGDFLMGSDASDESADWSETPQRTVHLQAYLIGRYEVTVGQYRAFAQATGYDAALISLSDRDDLPARYVSWDDASAFCAWASKVTRQNVRLPSEAEWEKAARGGDGRSYPWGMQEPSRLLCNSQEGGVLTTTEVGRYSPAGDSPYGCADMAGNVWEWTSSLFTDYPYVETDGRENPNATGDRVLRGGGFASKAPYVRCANRYGQFRDYREGTYGFRVCVDLY